MRSWPYYDASHDPDDVHEPWWSHKPPGWLVGVLLVLALILAMWAAAALGTWTTGVSE